VKGLVLENCFYRVHLVGVASDIESEIVQFLIQYGASGSSECLTFSQPDLTVDPRVFTLRKKNLDVFFNVEPKSEVLSKLKTDFQIDSYHVVREENQDWLAEWKKGYNPFIITPPYWIVPSWLDSPTSDEFTIQIDPGMAFGTGTHATTQMAAHFVKRSLRLINAPSANVLDVGTGTGILAILASKLGVNMVTSIDIDPECLRVSKENIELNGCSNILVENQDLQQIRGQFEVVIANIIDGVLIKLSHDLVRVTKSDGFLVLSGILIEHEDTFLGAFIEAHDLKIESRIEKDGWVSFLARKRLC